MSDYIKIRGAKVHNLKNISLDIPKNKLVVITGLSGSGKSSLAFDTIYAEGQRRYVESLSAYARQFLGVMDKPDVESIEGLSPAIAIDQKSVSRNPRSTVGTITEIYDYLRLLFSRVGKPYCPQCGKLITRQSPSQIVDQIIKDFGGEEIFILGPMIRGKKGEHRGILAMAQKAGFVRVRIDGIIHQLEEAMDAVLDKQKKHNIEVVVDQVEVPKTADKDSRARIIDSVETALKVGKGIVIVSRQTVTRPVSSGGNVNRQNSGLNRQTLNDTGFVTDKRITQNEQTFSELFACQDCGFSLPEIEPRLFSFNSPFGACSECQGLGVKQEIDPALVIPNKRLTLGEGAIRPWATASHRVGRQGWYWWHLSEFADKAGFSMDTPVEKLPASVIDKILYGDRAQRGQSPAELGDNNANFEGVIPNLERRWKETDSEFTRAEIEKYMLIKKCPLCHGKRLKKEALAVKMNGLNTAEIGVMSSEEALKFFQKLKLGVAEQKISQPIIKEISKRLKFLIDVGLNYLTIERESTTLSGGEGQRIRLATQIGSGLSGVVYILDEPSIGLHQRDMARLIKTLKELRDLGNTVIVVEHDAQTILAADWVIDIGPGAGEHGGKILFEGTPRELLKANTLTGEYLSGRKRVTVNRYTVSPPVSSNGIGKRDAKHKTINDTGCETVKPETHLSIIGASEHNLKNIDVKIPLARFVAVTGVSGSGKSTLINDILGRALAMKYQGARAQVGAHKMISGTENLDKVIIIDQSPIGRTPRSNPATYTGIFTPVRDIFAKSQEARIRGYDPGRFSFNVKGGRCEACEGDGVKKIEMYFLPDIYIECEECHGRRYNKEVLEIEFKGRNIAQILNMSVEEAREFFKNIPAIEPKLKTLNEVGLSYMKLGQSATTLSGGEAQRIKLATELARRDTGRTLYILDEPTTGLHFDDIRKLLIVLRQLVDRGNTVLVIEHNLDVIRGSDWIIDLGPEGGEKGGRIVAEGAVSDIIKNKESWTGKFLASAD